MNNSLAIHVGAEVFLGGAFAFWVHKQNSALMEEVKDLKQKVAQLETGMIQFQQVLRHHHEILTKSPTEHQVAEEPEDSEPEVVEQPRRPKNLKKSSQNRTKGSKNHTPQKSVQKVPASQKASPPQKSVQKTPPQKAPQQKASPQKPSVEKLDKILEAMETPETISVSAPQNGPVGPEDSGQSESESETESEMNDIFFEQEPVKKTGKLKKEKQSKKSLESID